MLQTTVQSLKTKKRSKKGFTLMEMLIVVAIIAILIAIAIPTFNSQLTKARKATDEANIRSAYAVMQASKLTGQSPKDGTDMSSDGTFYMQANGDFETTTADAYKLKTAIAAKDVPTVPAFIGGVNAYIVIQYKASSGAWTLGSPTT